MSCKYSLVMGIVWLHSRFSGSLTSLIRLLDPVWRRTPWWNCLILRVRPRILRYLSPRLWKNAIRMPKQWPSMLPVFQRLKGKYYLLFISFMVSIQDWEIQLCEFIHWQMGRTFWWQWGRGQEDSSNRWHARIYWCWCPHNYFRHWYSTPRDSWLSATYTYKKDTWTKKSQKKNQEG